MRRCRDILTVGLAVLILFLSACGESEKYRNLDENKITIIATLFPQYDFARQIAGEYANVILLLPPGMESHSYDPSPADIIAIQNSDIFLYTGQYMEGWAADVLDGMESDTCVVDVSAHITLAKEEDIEMEYESLHMEEGHTEHMEEHVHDSAHTHVYDPHIWTNPVYAMIMVEDIAEALMECDPSHKEIFRENADNYLRELSRLDADIRDMVENAQRRELFFGGRFAMYYFTREYGLLYESVYDSCSAETEPSVRSVVHVINEMRENKIPAIYYEELVDPRIARTISEETGSEMFLWHSCHSVSKKDLEEGVTYLSLMRQNLLHLQVGLGG